MVSSKLYITKLNYTQARSVLRTICIRLICYGLIFFFFAHPSYAVRWQDPDTSSSPWKGIWGQRDDNALYLGMWTRHLPGHNYNKNNINRLIGFNYYGVFGAIFYNSYDIKSYTVGIQRIVYSQKFPHYMQIDFGYRLGFIWGYKGTPILNTFRSIPFIKNMNPVFFPQIIGNFSWEMIGIQVSYCWAVVTAGFFVKI